MWSQIYLWERLIKQLLKKVVQNSIFGKGGAKSE